MLRHAGSTHSSRWTRLTLVGSKCLVPQLFERRFVSMVSLGVHSLECLMHLVGCAAPGHVFALRGNMLSVGCVFSGNPRGDRLLLR